MDVVALIMAGGRSERMRATGGPRHKALVRVLGVPMLERNICALIASGFRDIFVAFNASETEIEDWLHRRGIPLARAGSATLECLKERQPLGNMGIAGALRGRAASVLVTYVDNLTTIDLPAMMHAHRCSGAALTIASHREPFHIPFGELAVDGAGCITGYLEKPVHWVRISSGTYVLDAERACAAIPPEEPLDAAGLFRLLHGCGERITAYDHNAAWIDINDAAAIVRAEHLVAEHAAEFEFWHTMRPDRCVIDLVVCTEGQLLAERRGREATRYPGLWDLPGDHAPCGGDGGGLDDPAALVISARSVVSQLLGSDATTETITLAGSFDDLDIVGGALLRHHVFVVCLNAPMAAQPLPCTINGSVGRERCWFSMRDAAEAADQWASPALVRAAALVRLRGFAG
jgi:NDP-mannose synthase